MGLDPARGDGVTRAQISDQNLGGGHLARRRGLLVKVAHEADADPVLINFRALGIAAMDPVLLVNPPLGDLDLAVFRSRSVANHEMVAAAVIAQNLAVLAIDLVIISRGVSAMMQDDILPGPIGLVGIEELVAT